MDYFKNAPNMQAKLLATLGSIPFPSVAAGNAARLLAKCPRASQTPLIAAPNLARQAGVRSVHVKDERARMGLGSFKALGAAYVIACDAQSDRARGQTYVTASAGNHGLSVAAGAAAFGAHAVVYLAATVPEAFADRLRGIGADVRRAGETYEASMAAAEHAAERNSWTLLSDSSWPGYVDAPHVLMEGYTVLMQEVVAQIADPPTHIFLQAGVGGLAAACAAYARWAWGDAPAIVVVEPESAPAIYASVKKGSAQKTEGPVSAMGRLDCKEPSLIALKGLARDADGFMLITEEEGQTAAVACAQSGLQSTPSGAAGIAGMLASAAAANGPMLGKDARALVILSEEASP